MDVLLGLHLRPREDHRPPGAGAPKGRDVGGSVVVREGQTVQTDLPGPGGDVRRSHLQLPAGGEHRVDMQVHPKGTEAGFLQPGSPRAANRAQAP